MFGKNKEKKEKRMLDKVIMGAVIGGAIGSVLGDTIDPKAGKKTREELKEVAVQTKEGAKKFFSKIKNLIGFIKFKKKETKPPDTIHEMKKIPNETFK